VAHSVKKPYVELLQNLSPGWSSTTEAASAAVVEAREDHEVGRRSATLLGGSFSKKTLCRTHAESIPWLEFDHGSRFCGCR